MTDWQRLREVRLRALADIPDAFGSTLEREENFSDEKWMRRLSRQDAATFVAVSRDGSDIGLIMMAPYDDQIGLYGMWVSPPTREKGVGGKLVDAGISWAQTRGFNNVFLDVGDDNHSAIALYESRGFAPTGQRGSLAPPREHILEHQRLLQVTTK